MTHNAIQADFPALRQDLNGQRLVYLDSAATTLKPQSVVDAVSGYYSLNGANIHRGKHWLSETASDAFEEARVAIADYLGASTREIVFTQNTTSGLNLVAAGLELSEGACILGCLDAHHSQILPWRRVGRLHLASLRPDGRLDIDSFCELLTRHRPQVVALTHCSNVTGVVHPIETLVAEIRTRTDAVIVLDAAQSLPHGPIDVTALDVDFIAFSPHKMLGPTGVGCLYGRRARLETLRPLMVGGGMVDLVGPDSQIERAVPHRFEAGTPSIASVIGCTPAIQYLRHHGEKVMTKNDHALTEALVSGAEQRPYLKLIGPADCVNRHPIATLCFPDGTSVGEISRLLSDSYGIMCRSGFLCAHPLLAELAGREALRASAYLYNDVSDVEAFYAAIDELADWMKFDS